MKLIGIAGLAASGKSTLAKLLSEHYGFVEIAFADEMKRICQRVYGFSDEQLWGSSSKREEPDTRYPRSHTWRPSSPPGDDCCECCRARRDDVQCFLTPRYALNMLGDWGRHCFETSWVDKTLTDAKSLMTTSRYDVVISDVRFDNEARAIRAAGGIVVQRVGNPPEKASTHVSEKGVDWHLVDTVIPFFEDKAMLPYAVDALMKGLET